MGWEHFIRLYRYLLPKIVRELEKEEEAQSRTLARRYGLPRPIESMSKIELSYMNFFWLLAFIISATQIVSIIVGFDPLDAILEAIGRLAIPEWG